MANSAALELLLGSGMLIAPFDAGEAEVAGELRHRMEAKGRPMGAFDLLIAAHALHHGATLVTRDAAYREVEGLVVEDWIITELEQRSPGFPPLGTTASGAQVA